MADVSEVTNGGYHLRFFSPQQVDQILGEGSKRGRTGSHAAIERILKHEPALERAGLWRRLRQLKCPPRQERFGRVTWSPQDDQVLRDGYAGGRPGKQLAIRELLRRHSDWRPHIVWKRAASLGLIQKTTASGRPAWGRPWSDADDNILLGLAGYKDVRVIAQRLHRSPEAIRSRLRVLGKSTRFQKEGYSQRALSKELHLGNGTIRRLIIEGVLEVRDPRITRKSVRDLGTMDVPAISETGTERSLISLAGSEANEPSPGKSSRAKRVWMEVARELGVSVHTIEDYLEQGKLKVYDPRITEKSVRNFCRRYGSLVNYELLNRETREWLQTTMDFVRSGGEDLAQRLATHRKHARIVRACKCGRQIRGNAFFRHTKNCRAARIHSPTGLQWTPSVETRNVPSSSASFPGP